MKKFLSLFTMLAFLSVANVWGLDVTSTFTNDSWSVGNNEPAWTASTITVQGKVDKGVQVTLSNIKNASGFTLTNNTFKNTTGLEPQRSRRSARGSRTAAPWAACSTWT